MKSSVIKTNVYVNDQIVSTIQDLEPYTLYVNPYFVITEFSNADKVSKHYYMGTQRVASELAVQTTVYSPMVNNTGSSSGAAFTAESFKTLISPSNTLDQGLESQVPVSSNDPWLDNLNAALTEFGEATLTRSDVGKELPTIESIYPDLSPQSSYKTTSTVRVIYWYHPDYIGNVDLVTDMSGEAYEFFLYNPWGENLYEWNSGTSTWTSPYRFNGKELDQETGLHYYGARYVNSKLSYWISVDALAMSEHNRSVSPYQFTDNNPVNFIDPDGNSTWVTDNGDGTFTVVGGVLDDNDRHIYVVNQNDDGTYSTNYLSIGESMTTHSFVDENDDFVVGAIIDKSDTEATDIMNDINQNTPSVLSYIKNWRDYDYKGSGEKVEKYRGRITPSGEIASMRDVGNYVAGYVAGKANVPLTFARIAFERLQATNNMKDITNIFGDGKESTNSVMAQNKGWLEGYKEQLSMKTGVTYD